MCVRCSSSRAAACIISPSRRGGRAQWRRRRVTRRGRRQGGRRRRLLDDVVQLYRLIDVGGASRARARQNFARARASRPAAAAAVSRSLSICVGHIDIDALFARTCFLYYRHQPDVVDNSGGPPHRRAPSLRGLHQLRMRIGATTAEKLGRGQWRNNRACKACSARGPSAVGGPKFARRCFFKFFGGKRGPFWNTCTRAHCNLVTPLTDAPETSRKKIFTI